MAGTGTTAQAAVGAGDGEEWLPEVTDSRALSSGPLISGTVEKPDGSKAGNAYVYAQAWPDGESLGNLDEGAGVKTPVIAKTRTDVDGKYKLRVEDTAELADMASEAGNLDVDVITTDGSPENISTDTFSLRVSPTKEGENNQAGDLAQVSSAGTDEDPVIKPATVDPKMEKRDDESVDDSGTFGTQDFSNGCPTTGTKYLASYGKRWVYIGSNYQTGPSGANATFKYTKSAESSLGIGASGSGKAGSFSAGGSMKRSSTATIGFGTQGPTTGTHHYSMYVYGKYCTTTRSPGPSFTFTARPTSFAGGAKNASVGYPTANYCTPFPAGTNFTKDDTKMTSYSAGVKMDSAIGIDLTSQTGFTNTASVTFKFPENAALCGTKGYPAATPGRIAARGAGVAQ